MRSFFLCSLTLFLLTQPASAGPLAAKKPNIIFIITDDQGYGDLSCHGNPILKTPNIDKLYAKSVRFTDFQVSPTCAPTRSSLMTGRHEFKNGVTHTINERERMTLKAFTLAQLLKSAGYTSGIFGKWHLGDEPDYQPEKRGFDEVFIHGAGGIGQTYKGSCGDAPKNSYFDPYILHNGTFEKTKGYCTEVFFNQALTWLDAKRKDKTPFLCWISPNAPHGPLDVPPEYEAKYKGKTDAKAAKFFGMIANIDDNVGKLRAKLEEWGMADDTVIVFMTDNGGTAGVSVFNAGMRAGKGTPYEGGTHVPFFVSWPKQFPGGVNVDRLAAHIDVFPTFAELAGAKVPDGVKLDGRSLVPLLENPKADWAERHLITHVGRWEKGMAANAKYAKMAVRNSQYRLVHAGKEWELHDIKADPGEKTNVITKHPEVFQAMKGHYDRWWDEVQPLLVNEQAVGPQYNPFHVLFWKQYGGGPKP